MQDTLSLFERTFSQLARVLLMQRLLVDRSEEGLRPVLFRLHHIEG